MYKLNTRPGALAPPPDPRAIIWTLNTRHPYTTFKRRRYRRVFNVQHKYKLLKIIGSKKILQITHFKNIAPKPKTIK